MFFKEVAGTIQRKLIRSEDFFARFGGEEFVVLLFGSTLSQGEEIGERIRATIEKHVFEFEEKKLPITISVGLASQEKGMTQFDELFSKADAALYASKNSGRNRVTSL